MPLNAGEFFIPLRFEIATELEQVLNLVDPSAVSHIQRHHIGIEIYNGLHPGLKTSVQGELAMALISRSSLTDSDVEFLSRMGAF